MAEIKEIKSRYKLWFAFLVPIILLVVFILGFLKYGPLGVFEADVPPIENLFVQRVLFSPEHVELEVFNDGSQPVTVAQMSVNEAIWRFEMPAGNTLAPRETSRIRFFYPWIEGDPLFFKLISSNGVIFEKEVPVAFRTPVFDNVYFRTFFLLGLYVGVIPVLLGLFWFPFLRRLNHKNYLFLLSLTIGLLVFLGFDTLAESFELIRQVPESLNGIGVLVIGFLFAILILSFVSHRTEFHKQTQSEHSQALVWSYLIALGIGFHNLGEGLAIGSAYAIGEIALGGTLVVGFMVHNLTEGLAIVSPLTKVFANIGKFLWHIVLMALLAGFPTIIGTIIGGFAYSPISSVLFLAIGAGAIFDVAFDMSHHMAKGRWISLFSGTNVLGFLAGLLIMYATGFFVLA